MQKALEQLQLKISPQKLEIFVCFCSACIHDVYFDVIENYTIYFICNAPEGQRATAARISSEVPFSSLIQGFSLG